MQTIEEKFKNFDNDLLAKFYKDTLEKEVCMARQANVINVLKVTQRSAAAYLKGSIESSFESALNKIQAPERSLYTMNFQNEDREAFFDDFCERGIQGQWPAPLRDCSEDTQKVFKKTFCENKRRLGICRSEEFQNCLSVLLKVKRNGKLDELLQDLKRRAFSELPDPFLLDCNPNFNTIISHEDASTLRKLEAAVVTYKHRAYKEQCFVDIERYCADLPSKLLLFKKVNELG